MNAGDVLTVIGLAVTLGMFCALGVYELYQSVSFARRRVMDKRREATPHVITRITYRRR